MNKFMYQKQLFEVIEDTNVSTDFEPAISIDHTTRIADTIQTLMRVMGITEMVPMAEGSVVKVYKTTVTKKAGTVAEGDEIPLSKTDRKKTAEITLTLNKYRKLTTAEAIQKSGVSRALNESDAKLMGEVRKDVKKDFFAVINAASGSAAGGQTLQMAAAQAWGSLQKYYEDNDVTPVFFVNPLDVATYLGSAQITTQTAFGFTYIESFLGMGTALLSGDITQGSVFATAAENLNGVYVPANGDIANVFGLTYDESGLVGMTHTLASSRASVETLIMSGVKFYAEDAAGIFKSTIAGE